jgi:hypothetical protein
LSSTLSHGMDRCNKSIERTTGRSPGRARANRSAS